MELTIAIGTIGVICTILFSYISYKRGLEKECKSDGESKGVIASDIGYIKAGVDDLKRENREMNGKVSSHNDRIIRLEEANKQTNKRLDVLEYKEDIKL